MGPKLPTEHAQMHAGNAPFYFAYTEGNEQKCFFYMNTCNQYTMKHGLFCLNFVCALLCE